jgi:ABC-type sugar transport system permease subunit
VPAFITILIWKGLLNYHFGAANGLFSLIGAGPVPWLIDPHAARISVLLVSVWLGIPFMTVTASGIIQTLPRGIFEAARLDGSGPASTFFFLTVPLIIRRMVPVLVLGASAAFTNFTAIYLLTAGGPTYPGAIGGAGATDILISYIFKLTLTGRRYGLAAAYAVVIFVIIGIVTVFNMRFFGTRKQETF